MKTIIIDGKKLETANEIHKFLKRQFDWRFYGENLDALWDLITTDVERPFTIKWINAITSMEKMGEDYTAMINILKKAEQLDIQNNDADKFSLVIEP